MGMVRITLTVAGFCLALSACNTTDALTPPEAIGDAGSSPVTQGDVERMAAAPQRRQVYQDTQDSYGYRQQTSQQAYQPQGYGGTGTLDEQASALRSNGTNPYASRPLDNSRTASIASPNDQVSETDEQSEADRRLSEDPQPQQQQQQQADDSQQPEQQQASLPPAASAGGNSIRFLPIIGAPVEAVTPLSRQLGSDARSLGLTIKSSSDSSAAYILKGYLSAFQDGPAITVTYVWDVLDNSGTRLHRIQGNESVPLKAGDPWTAVPASVMQQIASKTIAEFTSWRATRGG